MKNGLIIWNLVLTAICGFLLFTHFTHNSGGNHSDLAKMESKADSTANHPDFKIAYFEMDSVEAHYAMVKEVKSEIDQREALYNKDVNSLDQIYRNKFNELSKPNMTQQEAESAQNELKSLGDKLKEQRQGLDQDYQDFITRKNHDVKKNIEEYLQTFARDRNFSYIISYEPGLYYYKDTAYNITPELIKGLNSAYKPAKSN